MTLFNKKYRVESARLRSWDYTWPWWYYVTICTRGMEEHFGSTVDGVMKFSELGRIAKSCWDSIPKHIAYIELDVVQVMPNHIHGIIILNEIPRRDVACNVSTQDSYSQMSQISPKRGSLGVVIRSYKSAVTNEARRKSHASFAWQPRFYDHIIRNEHDLFRIRTYITQNALSWDLKKEKVNGLVETTPARLREFHEAGGRRVVSTTGNIK